MTRIRIQSTLSLSLAALLAAASPACSGETEQTSPPPEPAPSEEPEAPAQSDPAPAPAAPAASADGAAVYTTYCVTCHGPEGRGDGPGAAALDPKPRDFAVGDFQYDPDEDGERGELEDIVALVRDGASAYGGSPLMAPWGAVLNEPQIEAVAEHVRGLKQ